MSIMGIHQRYYDKHKFYHQSNLMKDIKGSNDTEFIAFVKGENGMTMRQR